jgi:transposase-like protein
MAPTRFCPGRTHGAGAAFDHPQEAIIVAFRKHTLLPLDDCLYALQATIPQLSRSVLHRCLQRHGISRLAQLKDADAQTKKRKFKAYPIGYFHVDITEVATADGKLQLFVAIDRTSKFAVARLMERANTKIATDFLHDLVATVPYRIHTVLTDNGLQFADLPKNRQGATARWRDHPLLAAWHRASSHQAQPPVDQRPSQTHQPHHQGSHRSDLSL